MSPIQLKKMNIFKLSVFLLLFNLVEIVFAIDTLDVNTDNEKAVELMLRADSEALVDSINKILLQTQLDELRNSERLQRRKIEAELQLLKEKDSIGKVNMLAEINQLKHSATGFPVIVHKDTLLVLYTKIGSLTPKERATVVTERLLTLYREYLVKADSLVLVNSGSSVDVFFKEMNVLSVTDLDELWYGESKMAIATKIKNRIESDVRVYKRDRSVMKLVKETGLVLLIVLILVGLVKGVNYYFRAKVNVFLWKKRGVWFKGLSFRKTQLIDANKETSLVLVFAKLMRYALIVLLLYLTLPIIFSIFPLTQRLADVLFAYILSPIKVIVQAFLGYIPELITIAVIVAVTRLLLRFLRFVSVEIENERLSVPGFFPDWAKPTYNIVKVLLLAFMFVVVFPYLPGSDSPVFKGVSVFLGIVFSLGSTSIIGNMIAGLVITYMRPFKIGDRIKIGEVDGSVVEKTAFVTRIRTPKKEFITIPNSNVLSSNVINYSNSKLQGGMIVHTTVTIGYDVPWRKVHQALVNAAKQTANLNMGIAPFVHQTSLDDFYVSYQLNAHTNEPDKLPAIYSELHENIQDRFNEEGIEILSPHYRAARDGNKIAIPDDYLPPDYKAPGFRVENTSD